MSLISRCLACVLLLALAFVPSAHATLGETPTHARVPMEPCIRPKDFAVYRDAAGTFHVFYIRSDRNLEYSNVSGCSHNANDHANTNTFGHRSSFGNLKSWGPPTVINLNPRSVWNHDHIWAPYIVKRNSTYYMFYAGVEDICTQQSGGTCTQWGKGYQGIGAATSPDLYTWTPLSGPSFALSDIASYADTASGELRDPFLMFDPRPGGNTWLMHYTAKKLGGTGIIGTAESFPDFGSNDPLTTHFLNFGPLVTTHKNPGAGQPGEKTESPHLFQHNNLWYLLTTGCIDGSPNCANGGVIHIFTNTDPMADTWTYRGNLSNMLKFNTNLWYASEYIQDPSDGSEYLGVVRQSPGNTDVCPCPGDTSVIEFRKIIWGSDWRFTLSDPYPAPTRWAQHAVSGPSARREHSVAYDASGHRMFLYGGTDGTNVFNDTWILSSGPIPTWTQITPSGGIAPVGRRRATLVYDSARDRLLMFGGYFEATSVASPRNDIYALGPLSSPTPTWTQLSPNNSVTSILYGTQGIYDSARDRLLVVDGAGSTWELPLAGSPLHWNLLAGGGLLGNAGGFDFNLTYDAGRDRLVAYGGWWDGGYDFDGASVFPLSGVGMNSWSQFEAIGPKPAPRSLATAVYDPVRDALLVVGGRRYFTGTIYSDVWELSMVGLGSWSQLSPSGTALTGRYGLSATYDPTNDRALVFGGTGSSGNLADLRSLTWDVYSPDQVTDLSALVHCESIDLSWTSPGDDGVVGPAAQYEVRRSGSPITNGNWTSAGVAASGMPAAAGTVQTITLNVGKCSIPYYYAVRVKDEVEAWSSTSNNTSRVGTPCPGPHELCIDEEFAKGVEPLEGLEVTGPQPARSRAKFSFYVPAKLAGLPCELSIYDVSGRRVAVVEQGPARSGRSDVFWNLSSAGGDKVRSGVYFARLRLGKDQFTRTVVLLGP